MMSWFRTLIVISGLTAWVVIGASCDGGCPQICQPNQKQCSQGGVLVCIQSPATQCMNWAFMPCQPGQSCQGVGAAAQCGTGGVNPPPPPGQCTNPRHEKRCVGQDIYWFDDCGKQRDKWTTCPPGVPCQNGLCTSSACQDPCTPGARRCSPDGSGYQECPNSGDSCPQWGTTVPCGQGQRCTNGRCESSSGGCSKLCQAGALRCQGAMVQVCQNTQPNCSDWSTPVPCPTGQTCKNGFCSAGSGTGPCQDECSAGQHRCQGTKKQLCKHNGQCNVWTPQPCGVNAQCVASAGRVSCSCLPGYVPDTNGRDCKQETTPPPPPPPDGGPPPDRDPPPPPSQDCGMNALEKGVFDLVNKERQQRGASALGCNEKLVQASRDWSKQQCARGGLSHANLGPRVRATGLSVSTYGENVAWGSKTSSGVMNMWMNSSGHRKNILSSSYSHIGVGLDLCNGRYFWTQIFVRMR